MILSKAVFDWKDEALSNMLKAINIILPKEEQELVFKNKLRAIFRRWLPISVVMETIVVHLPSPVKAQYKNPKRWCLPNEPNEQHVQNCDPDGPLIIYVDKMIPLEEK